MRLLFADDDPVTLEALHACAISEGFEVVLARDGKEALAVWKRHHPHLVCLDIMMPKLDGYGVCRQIRETDPHLPILFLSAKSEEIDVVVGLQLGADDFIRKPFGKHEFLARIRTALRRSQSPREEIPHFKMRTLVIWPRELRAEREKTSIDLSPREIAILKIFHASAGMVVSRDTLLNRCWGMDYFPESRTLDQHIAVLRKKIEIDPNNPQIIETVRGVGYRFREKSV